MIRLVVALAAEARPLARRFELERIEGGPLPLWRGTAGSMVVSGVGRAAAAAAVGYLAGLEPAGGEAAWINVGVGGHRELAVGEAVLAHKIVERASGRAWYPPLVIEPDCPTATVMTVDRPESSYPEDVVYEMEAAGFCAAASRFASAELVQVVKVISDNAASPAGRLSAGRVKQLIGERLDLIARLAEDTAALAAELRRLQAPPALMAELLARWRFSVSQRRQLERLLRRLAVLEPAELQVEDLAGRTSAGAVLAALERRLAEHAPGVG